ncbi:MAG TPA: hypothetical protein VKA49_18215 [Flavitalea sp.]|nr:hypothetical protein [Flavitalea sp.]
MDRVSTKTSFEQSILWGVLLLYLIVTGYTTLQHEMWGDEIHSWNIAKGSISYSDLIYNSRYEGHPPVWYTILWTISKFTHEPAYVQMIHWFIAALIVFLVLFFSPMPLLSRVLIPFGYYFLYEYSVLSRNYAIGILLACCICIIIRKDFPYKLLLYYVLLFLMSNTHLLALVLAGCLHLYFLLRQMEQKKSSKIAAIHILAGVLIFLPSLYFIFPPSDSQLNTQYWINRWNSEQIKALGQAPLRSFIPVPAWWETHFWNTQFLLDSPYKSRFLNLVIALLPLTMAVLILYREKKSLVLFLSNLMLSFIIALVVFPLTSARYAGFLYIGFVIAYWLYCYEVPVTRKRRLFANSLLIVQVITGLLMAAKDIRLPFSNASKVTELLRTPAPGEKMVTDYWAMNTISAFADRPIYCIDVQREMSFVLWGPELGNALKKPFRYFEGVKNLFEKEKLDKIYMISTGSPEMLHRADEKLFKEYQVVVIDKRTGAIEKGGNLYLYEITEL